MATGENEITVRTPGGTYGVVVERDVLRRTGEELDRVAAGRPWAVITDRVVWRHWGQAFEAAVAPRTFSLVRLPPGEEQKRIATAEYVFEQLVKLRLDRTALIIGFGGGVIGDLAGFVASVFLRGVAFANIPTTLLAQIDSSVGGKTGVNLAGGKNLVGTFYQPRRVLADPEVLRTLPARELRAGLYEAIKCGVLKRPLFDFIERERAGLLAKDPDSLAELVRRSIEVKAWVVSRDEREAGLRRVLNLGHTIGHALEAETGYSYFLHGEAVAWGLRAITLIAEQRGFLPSRDAERIHALVRSLGGLPPLVRISPRRLAHRLLADKKTLGGVVHFVIPARIGKVQVVTGIDTAAVVDALDRLRKESAAG